MLLVATRPGANSELAQSLVALGSEIRFRDDAIDYLRALVPIDQVEALAGRPNIEAAAVDMAGARQVTELNATDAAQARAPAGKPPDASTPPESPYIPTRDMGAPQFIAAHPTFDGRGAVIADVDAGFDLLTPELQTAIGLDGQPARKIIERITVTHPLDGDDPCWIDMADTVQASGGVVTYRGLIYRTPADRSYRIGFINERDPRFMLGEAHTVNGDLNRDGNPPGSSGDFAILWDEAADIVWVDTNQDRSFVGETPMTNYGRGGRYDIGVFGKDDPETAIRESVPFVVQTDATSKFVHIGVAIGVHGTYTSSAAAGRGFFGGRLNGAAPAAQLVLVSLGSNATVHSHVEGLIVATRHPKVDVVTMSSGHYIPQNDGGSVGAIVASRLVKHYKKPIFISAGNGGPAMDTVGDPSTSPDVLSVGAYVHRSTWLSNYGLTVDHDEDVAGFSSRGPSEDGGLKPDILAPAASVTARPALHRSDIREGLFDLPPGYAIGGGTSLAAPFAAGAAALLVSSAKQAGIAWDADRIRHALIGSARFIHGYAAHEQGNGLIHVGRAWDLLRRMNRPPVAISSRAVVRTAVSSYFAIPHEGPGIYEREGWSVGTRGERAITLRRTSGVATSAAYALRWVGNDGTFETADSVTLPLDTPVQLPVSIAPSSSGVHSAILNLLDPDDGSIAHQVLNTVVVAERLAPDNGFHAFVKGEAPSLSGGRHSFSVPPGAGALRVRADVSVGTVTLNLYTPEGKPYRGFQMGDDPSYQKEGTWDRVIENPVPGVWEAVINNRWDERALDGDRAVPLPSAKYTLDVSAFQIEPNAARAAEPHGARGTAVTNLLFTNRMHGFTDGTATGRVASVFSSRLAFDASHRTSLREVAIPMGTSRLEVRIAGASNRDADLDVFVFDCTAKAQCVLTSFAVSSNSDETVRVFDPNVGTWKVVVYANTVGGEPVQVEYLEAFVHPRFGSVNVSAARQERGTAWSVTAQVTTTTAVSAEEPGRHLEAFVDFAPTDLSVVTYRRRPNAPFFIVPTDTLRRSAIVATKRIRLTPSRKR